MMMMMMISAGERENIGNCMRMHIHVVVLNIALTHNLAAYRLSAGKCAMRKCYFDVNQTFHFIHFRFIYRSSWTIKMPSFSFLFFCGAHAFICSVLFCIIRYSYDLANRFMVTMRCVALRLRLSYSIFACVCAYMCGLSINICCCGFLALGNTEMQ